ncbi:hypothetical protein P4T54_29935 [Bacillus mycoides]|uniref:hypothetical protein n=1 Tax=Bacillus mycoides TaxID=1405 RepID=UPI002E1E19E3|nr:hypothetical protein [Bacillus mycoides]
MKSWTIEEIYQQILDGKRRMFPRGTWSEDIDRNLIKRVTRYLIEVILEWDKNQIKEKWDLSIIKKHKLGGAIAIIYNDSPFKMINDAYPGLLKEWELKMAPLNYWTKETGLEALRWTIEEKERLTMEQLKEVYNHKWLIKHKLHAPCHRLWENNAYLMINDLYPNQFKPFHFKCATTNYWTKEIALRELACIIQEEQLVDEELLEVFSVKWIATKKLSTPLMMYWQSSPFQMINDLYPNKFKPWQFKSVPSNYWTKQNAIKAIFHIIQKDNLQKDELPKIMGSKWFYKNRLGTPFQKFWEASPYSVLNDLFPDYFQPYQFSRTPNLYWTKERSLQILSEYIQQEGWSDEEILENVTFQWLTDRNLWTPVSNIWESSPFKMVNDLYPNRFKPWQFKATYRNYWTKETALNALKWTIEEKECLSREELIDIYSQKWLFKHRLQTPCKKFWKSSPFAMLNALYPNKFKEWEFFRVPSNYWTKEKALEELRWIIEEREKLSRKELLNVFSGSWIKGQGLSHPLQKFWGSRPYHMLNELYPNCFKEWELKKTPTGFWTKEKGLEALRWTIEEKEKLTKVDLLQIYSKRWLREHGLSTPLQRFWRGNINLMFQDLYEVSIPK